MDDAEVPRERAVFRKQAELLSDWSDGAEPRLWVVFEEERGRGSQEPMDRPVK
jgi:hypothetical protein